MGQRLILAITLLIVGRLATFISPLPAAQESGRFLPEKSLRSLPSPISTAEAPSKIPPSSVEPFENTENPILTQEWQIDPPSNSGSAPINSAPLNKDTNPIKPWDQGQSESFEHRQSPSSSAPGNRITDVCAKQKPAVVTVHAGREIGSGSIINPSGLVITNYHVVRRLREQSLYVKAQDGRQYTGQVINSDRRNDLALIQLATQTPLPAIRIAPTATPSTGQAVCAIGSPFGRAGTITLGQLVRILPNGDLQSDVELQPGSSGGPLINAQGEMIGVNKGVARDRGERSNTSSSQVNSARISYATSAIEVDRLIGSISLENSTISGSLSR